MNVNTINKPNYILSQLAPVGGQKIEESGGIKQNPIAPNTQGAGQAVGQVENKQTAQRNLNQAWAPINTLRTKIQSIIKDNPENPEIKGLDPTLRDIEIETFEQKIIDLISNNRINIQKELNFPGRPILPQDSSVDILEVAANCGLVRLTVYLLQFIELPKNSVVVCNAYNALYHAVFWPKPTYSSSEQIETILCGLRYHLKNMSDLLNSDNLHNPVYPETNSQIHDMLIKALRSRAKWEEEREKGYDIKRNDNLAAFKDIY